MASVKLDFRRNAKQAGRRREFRRKSGETQSDAVRAAKPL